MTPQFFYFDVGNVLLRFSHEQACRQIGALMDLDAQHVWRVLFESGLEMRSELGELTGSQLFDEFCGIVDRRAPYEDFAYAASAIFTINTSIKAVVANLRQSGKRLGLLSNTSEIHWQYFADGRYGLIPEAFEVHALSFELHAVKPQREIFEKAVALAGVPAEQIFFVDDIPQHVAGARAAGIDAVLYTTTSELGDELRRRGVRLNF